MVKREDVYTVLAISGVALTTAGVYLSFGTGAMLFWLGVWSFLFGAAVHDQDARDATWE